MSNHESKMIVPIIVTILLVFYLIVYAIVCIYIPLPVWVKVMGIIMLLALAGTSVYLLIQRINEIRSGEEDDLSNY